MPPLGPLLLFLLGPAALGCLYEAFLEAQQARAMTAVADATVVGVDIDGSARSKQPIFRWTYEGETFEHESLNNNMVLSEGDRTRVRFDPDNPELVLQDGFWRRWSGPMIMTGAGLLLLAFSALAVMGLLKRMKAAKADAG